MSYTLRQAARAVGRDRTTLMRAIQAGRLSATRDTATGAWLIEAAELHRLYPPVERTGAATGGDAEVRTPDAHDAELRARLADAQETIADLRRRLDTEAEERRRLTALLTDQRAQVRRTWWPWRR